MLAPWIDSEPYAELVAAAEAERVCRCLYCDKVTGRDVPVAHPTVCERCTWLAKRDEALEIAAGMGPWSRPLSYWVRFCGWKPTKEMR